MERSPVHRGRKRRRTSKTIHTQTHTYEGKKCGHTGAYNALKDVTCINDAANLVIDAYRKIDQNVLAEGWLLWLTRWHKDNVVNYMRSLELSGDNRQFVEDCLLRDWVVPREVNDECV